jgi:hypothetical protein
MNEIERTYMWYKKEESQLKCWRYTYWIIPPTRGINGTMSRTECEKRDEK